MWRNIWLWNYLCYNLYFNSYHILNSYNLCILYNISKIWKRRHHRVFYAQSRRFFFCFSISFDKFDQLFCKKCAQSYHSLLVVRSLSLTLSNSLRFHRQTLTECLTTARLSSSIYLPPGHLLCGISYLNFKP